MSQSERTRMEQCARLQTGDWQTAKEYAYEEGYENTGHSLTELLGHSDDFWIDVGRVYFEEGADAADDVIGEEIQECMDHSMNEILPTHLDGQFRLFAGYDVAENGDTIEEGSYNVWENLRMAFEAGVYDAYRGNDLGETSISHL